MPFVRVAGYLETMRLGAPRVIAADLDQGFLLLSDLGQELYLDRLESHPLAADSLYDNAIDALLILQQRGVAFQSSLPKYDGRLLRAELSLFRDWLCTTHLNLEFTPPTDTAWQTCCDMLVDNARHQPQVFVHRDYHSRNLMVGENETPGILDFQDAVEGPFTYDLVSLLKDCYIDWPAEQVHAWALSYCEKRNANTGQRIDEALFFRYFELMGVQRQLKAAGIFCRLWHRDGKAGFLADVPRTLNYIVELGSKYDELRFLIELIEHRVLPVWEQHL